jgi:hypothetical protein
MQSGIQASCDMTTVTTLSGNSHRAVHRSVEDIPMRESIAKRRELNASIAEEIAERTRIHQANIARLKTAHASIERAGKPAEPPLVMLAHGDSWFDYPLSGNNSIVSRDRCDRPTRIVW